MAGASGSAGHPGHDIRDASAIHLQACACPTNTDQPAALQHMRVAGNDQRNQGLTRATSPRKTKSGSVGYVLLFDNVSPKETRRLEQTNFQPQTPQSVHNPQEVSIDISLSNTKIPAEPRLAGKNRPLISLFSCTDNRLSSSVPAPDLPESFRPNPPGLSDDQSSIRAVMCTEELCNDNQLDGSSAPEERYESSGLSRRLFTGQSVKNTVREGSKCRRAATTASGLDHQSREICNETYARAGVPRHQMGHQKESQSPSSDQGKAHTCFVGQHEQSDHCDPKGMSALTGYPQLCQFSNSRGKTSLSAPPKTLSEVEPVARTTDYHTGSSKARFTVVALCHKARSHEESFARDPCSKFFDNRCCRLRLGSSTGRLHSSRQVESKAGQVALQPKGNVCNNFSNKTFQTSPKEPPRNSPIRQSNCGCLCSKRGRDTIGTSSRPDIPVISVTGQVENNPHGRIPSRAVQSDCGQLITRQEISRMAFTAGSTGENFSEVRSTGHRSLCIEKHQCCNSVCIERFERLFSSFLQRFQQKMDLQSSLAISAPLTNTQSSTSSEHSGRYVPLSSTTLEADLLVTRPSPTGYRPTHEGEEPTSRSNRSNHGAATSSSTGHEAFSMESWGWADTVTDWTEAEKSLLKSSWRESTLKTYKPAWLRWVKWCKTSNYDYKHPNGNSLSRYLAFLHLSEKMSYATILLHKSVILTLGLPKDNLNTNFLIKHILKAISLEQPKSEKPPVWDPSDLISWLSINSPDRLNLFETSRRLACLLLLASGRRVHDLTLLRVSPEHFIDLGDHLILWPIFGSKTDTATYRQSGWKLKVNSNNNICPVYWLRKILELGEQRRTAECNNALFISVTGEVKAATRTLISNWIKTVFRDAGIKASPGSMRSAVASLNWWDNLPVDEILSRGNWRSENTFSKFYCRQIKNRNLITATSNNLINNFQPI